MTDEQLTWDGIYRSLVEDKNSELFCNLTEHLDTLYDKIAELEARLEKLEWLNQKNAIFGLLKIIQPKCIVLLVIKHLLH